MYIKKNRIFLGKGKLFSSFFIDMRKRIDNKKEFNDIVFKYIGDMFLRGDSNG